MLENYSSDVSELYKYIYLIFFLNFLTSLSNILQHVICYSIKLHTEADTSDSLQLRSPVLNTYLKYELHVARTILWQGNSVPSAISTMSVSNCCS